MKAIGRFFAVVVVVFGLFFLVRNGMDALLPTLPSDMPRDAKFVQTGYDIQRNEPKGDWIACRADPAHDADICRVTDHHGAVIYQGDFLPVSGSRPVAKNDLKLAKMDAKRMWVQGPTEALPVPVIPLANGEILVPVNDASVLAERWAKNPGDFALAGGE